MTCDKCKKTESVETLGCDKKHHVCLECIANDLEHQFDKSGKSFLDLICPLGCNSYVFSEDLIKKYAKKTTLDNIEMVKKTLPTNPQDPKLCLSDFCYKFNEQGKLVHSITGDKFHWVNQVHYDLLGDIIAYDIQQSMMKDFGMKEVLLPLDWETQGLQKWQTCNIFMTEDALTNPDRLMLLIQGSGAVRAGQWARALCINESLEIGAIFNYLKDAKKNGFGVIVFNPNLTRVPKVFSRPAASRFLLRGKPSSPPIETQELFPINSPEKHVVYVYDHFATKAAAKDLVLVAHSYGGVCTLSLLANRFSSISSRLRGIAFTDAVHHVSYDTPSQVLQFLKYRACNWVESNKPLDTPEPLGERISGCPCVSSGHAKHEYTSESARTSVFKFLLKKLEKEEKICLICSKPASKMCTRCKNARYCSVECQKSDWPSHKQKCQSF